MTHHAARMLKLRWSRAARWGRLRRPGRPTPSKPNSRRHWATSSALIGSGAKSGSSVRREDRQGV